MDGAGYVRAGRRPWPVEVRAEAVRLRSTGLPLREVSRRTGVPVKTISQWMTDSDGSRARARKESYRGSCVDCGAPTNGSGGPGKAAERCVRCGALVGAETRRRWTREALIGVIRRWAELYGEPPAVADWNAWQAEHDLHDLERAERYRSGEWPEHMTVVNMFGSWNAALAAAGFEPRERFGTSENMRRTRRARAKVAA